MRDISFAYGAGTPMEVRALDGISLDIDRGHLALVLGPTGSGKSTLLRVVAGLLIPDTGTVTVDGEPIRSGSIARSGSVGIVFQSPETQLFSETVLGDVSYGPRNQGLSKSSAIAEAEKALSAVGLDPQEFGRRSPFGLSGGEARRVALAGVLAMRPSYLLLDEPTAGLDWEGRTALAAALRAIRSTTGLIVVTHDAEEFLGEAQTALVLGAGSPVFTGPADELIARPSILAEAGLRPPPVLEALERARAHGADLQRLTLDPVEAAELLVRAREGYA